MEAKTDRNSAIIFDDGAIHAEPLARKERMPVFDKNGLDPCDGVTFSPELKRKAWSLIRPA